jgi:hypothetical protein
MKAAVARFDRHGQLWILEMLRKGFSLIGLQEIPERDPQPFADGLDCHDDIAQPFSHRATRLEF